jgi:hypothetical protein
LQLVILKYFFDNTINFIFNLIGKQYNFVNLKPLVGINIRPSEDNEFPFIVSIMQINYINPDPTMDHLCAGSMISRKDVLTSEHCISMEVPNAIKVIVGSTNLYDGNEYFINWWISYDQLKNSQENEIEFIENDISIIRVS